jgi:hypothetical protein
MPKSIEIITKKKVYEGSVGNKHLTRFCRKVIVGERHWAVKKCNVKTG